MPRPAVLLATIALVVCTPNAAQRNPATVDTLLDTAVEQKRVPMVVAMVADAHGIVYEHASGAGKDVIFAIASMTKPVTSVAVMQLVEAGRVKLEEPAATYVPELANVRVLDGGTLRPQKTPITVRHLLTHTSGFGYEFLNRDLFELVSRKELTSVMAGGEAFLKAPLLFDAGTRWEYGISTDWAGRLVERVSGQSLDAYFRQKIFDPLGMTETYFNVPATKQSRMLPVFQRTADGGFANVPSPPVTAVQYYSGGGGLYSTASDYLKFARAVLAGGQLQGRRILSASSIATMGTNQIGALTVRNLPSVIPQLATDGSVLPGALDKFGLGFALNSKPIDKGRGANTMSWAGIYNTFFWIDREKQVCAVLLTQALPFLDAGSMKLLEDFDRAVYAWRAP
jgi:CubicO group peptidase (beta-lactamase class C family)